MTSVTMINDAMMGATARRPLNSTLIGYFLCHSLTAADKASPQAKPVIAALKPSTPSRQNRACRGPQRCAARSLAPVFVIAASLCLLSLSVQAQEQNQTP